MNYNKEELWIGGENNRIYAQKLSPEKESGKLVILSHGYNSTYEGLMDMAVCFAEKGHTAVCFDFRGGSARSKSDGSSLDMSVGSEISDLEEVVNAAESAGYDRICLYGESQGGFVSALAAAAHPEKYIGVALLYPAFCIPNDWKDRSFADNEAKTINFMGMELSQKFVEGLPDYDVFEKIKDFDKPVLIMHGDKDPLVRLSYSEKAAAGFPNARLEVFSGETHGFKEKARKRAAVMTADFIESL